MIVFLKVLISMVFLLIFCPHSVAAEKEHSHGDRPIKENCSDVQMERRDLFEREVEQKAPLRIIVTKFTGLDEQSEALGNEIAAELRTAVEEYVRQQATWSGFNSNAIKVRHVPCSITAGHEEARSLGMRWGADLVFWGQASCPIKNPRSCKLSPILINSGKTINYGNITTGDNSPVEIGRTIVNVKHDDGPPEVGAFRTSLTVVNWRRMEVNQKNSVSVQLDPKSIQDLDFPRIAAAQPLALFRFVVAMYLFNEKKFLRAAEIFANIQEEIFAGSENQEAIYFLIGTSFLYAGKSKAGLSALKSALRACENASPDRTLGCRAQCLTNLGWAYAKLGSYKDALLYYEQALSITEHLDKKSIQATVLNNMGYAYQSLKKLDLALRSYQSALALAHDMQNLEGKAYILSNIGSILATQGRLGEALTVLTEARSIYRGIKKHTIAIDYFSNYCQSGIETVEEANRKHRGLLHYAAEKRFQGVLSTGEISGHLAININLGDVAYALGRFHIAQGAYFDASADAEAVGDVEIQCKILERLRIIRGSSGPSSAEPSGMQPPPQYYKALGKEVCLGKLNLSRPR